jgi:hypothetical protein
MRKMRRVYAESIRFVFMTLVPVTVAVISSSDAKGCGLLQDSVRVRLSAAEKT